MIEIDESVWGITAVFIGVLIVILGITAGFLFSNDERLGRF